MIYGCDKCNLMHEDDDLECTCGSTEITIFEYCEGCYDLCNPNYMHGGLCDECNELPWKMK